jgi:hypothetical protein
MDSRCEEDISEEESESDGEPAEVLGLALSGMRQASPAAPSGPTWQRSGFTRMHYNFARVDKTLRVTPAMEAGLTDHVWSLVDIARLAN